jgi:hypothetical protein
MRDTMSYCMVSKDISFCLVRIFHCSVGYASATVGVVPAVAVGVPIFSLCQACVPMAARL